MIPKKGKLSKAREQRLATVATLYLRRYSQRAIAEACQVSETTVSFDLDVLHERWRAEQLESTAAYKADALRRIDDLETQYAELYRRSLEPAVVESVKSIEVPVRAIVNRGGRPPTIIKDKRTEASKTTEQRVGMKAALDGMAWCIAERAKLLGLYPDQKIRLGSGSGAEPLVFTLELGAARPADAHSNGHTAEHAGTATRLALDAGDDDDV